ncbi:MAG TPA: YHS domain-containing protein [Gordonia sp. (in: high G+C Gram-positive bacteria)]|jgi:class 3 adenylate cyclase/YHS domain-containing protein|uniref:adenylate/guanylate cyclase domain-containing protein n=1 Tax=unclassified Gordonia (in: high G+C Gram-positive bacteria) TaxID=2657482 RepID=UPI0025B921EE|nr:MULTISPECIES: adenylate/guanylate cyclase domain-containing protein [unclassified Gordonia (in: high G+C Gram-positive bacteria)]HNP56459.1 YHS domain-containing protein [Gordonia sp. (in: high G+C Gram-positive bacteria)]HRC50788.1 YHS domain-containing protein [Gordonia sp. (in: high G+C Gram-positive bacteria)]
MSSPSVWTFVMIDLAGFTALTEVHGDEHAANLAVDFAATARSALGPADRFIKAIGDAVLLASPDPPAGLDLAQRIIAACTAKDQYLQTRTALHHGPATQRGDDFFGATVNLTARLCAHAAAGQTLVTGPVADAARTLALTITDLGEATFKNITEPTPIYALDLGASTSMQSMDPICRMRIEHDRAAGYLRHNGHQYWFCSLDCATQFLRQAESEPTPT